VDKMNNGDESTLKNYWPRGERLEGRGRGSVSSTVRPVVGGLGGKRALVGTFQRTGRRAIPGGGKAWDKARGKRSLIKKRVKGWG